MDRRCIGLVPHGAYLVNIARGPYGTRTRHVMRWRPGALGGILTEVIVPESMPTGHRLWRRPGLLQVPHVPHVPSDDPQPYNDSAIDILFVNLRAIRYKPSALN
ncbi:NAD(P)-dependent oxidoreductase [Falsiroseomonas sp. E2-1-a20]|uniref:NAD(P)-dependent oxidoreductase n=1 Tax=Falsiroseomonas sp. E2-1-a20 TaxID=3239300 RepID=UPI003F2AD78C